MTASICQQCGESNIGALIPCSKCEFRPLNRREIDVALILTDHYLEYRDLKKIGRTIKSGQNVELFYYFLSRRRKLFWRLLKALGLRDRFRKDFETVEIRQRQIFKSTMN